MLTSELYVVNTLGSTTHARVWTPSTSAVCIVEVSIQAPDQASALQLCAEATGDVICTSSCLQAQDHCCFTCGVDVILPKKWG